ncbi:MAG: NADH-quinone oxidoreductase subunit NuoH [Planctomycetota bacterium]|nr:NADH-quinone oxidoreductase subunit NuoH [Planctomycetota bacterium]MDA1105854.1 NADH-quinone oxidoreductase subunit NuoH [Planctomycetota bacterium]
MMPVALLADAPALLAQAPALLAAATGSVSTAMPATGGWSQVIANAVVIVLMLHVMLVGCAYSILLERKLSAWMQDRVGPNRVGPMGLLQPIADGLKFILKEEYTPGGVDRTLFTLAPALAMIPAMIAFVIIPWGGILNLDSLPFGLAESWGVAGTSVQLTGASINVGIIYLVAASSLGVYGVALGGWASNSKFSFLGGLRASAQMISYEIPMGLALLAVALLMGSLQPYDIIAQQQSTAWNILQQPVAAFLFYVCMLAEANRAPFDLAEAESELVGGFHTEYSSMRFAMFFLGEYFHLITGAAFFSLLFLGGFSINPIGGLLPAGWDLPMSGGLVAMLLGVGVMLVKTGLVVAFGMAIRWTLPRFRFDQLMKLAWEGMIPIALLVLTATAVVVYFGAQDWMWLASIGCIGIIYVVEPWMPRQPNPNHKLPMLGSKYSAPQPGTAASDLGY